MNLSEKTSLLARWAASAEAICTVCHTHPDGDALGSSAALWHFLAAQGKKVTILLPDAQPPSLEFILAGTTFATGPEEASAALAACDLLVCLDFNTFSRTESLEQACRSFKGRKVLIDHHEDPSLPDFDLCFTRTDVSSACELLYEVLLCMPQTGGDPSRLPAPAAAALMTGMTTDTNNFANSVYPGTLRMASALLEAGTDRGAILDRLYSSGREERLRAQGDILLNRMSVTPEGAAIIVLTDEIQSRYALLDGETEGFVNLPLSIEKVRLSIFARQEGSRFRVSIRSKRGTSARLLAIEAFHGGGHELAAGGKILIPEDIPGPGQAAAYVETAAARFLQHQDAASTKQ